MYQIFKKGKFVPLISIKLQKDLYSPVVPIFSYSHLVEYVSEFGVQQGSKVYQIGYFDLETGELYNQPYDSKYLGRIKDFI